MSNANNTPPRKSAQERVAAFLRSRRDAFTSGAEIGGSLGISRSAVWKHIKALERDGYVLEAAPSRGYRLLSAPDRLTPDGLAGAGGKRLIGRSIELHRETDSTNTLAMAAAARGAAEGTVVLAETQRAGRGRLGRSWCSPPGNVYLSVVLRPPVPVVRAPLITLMGAVAVASAVRRLPGLAAAIKWPNDIFLSGKKTAGLLTEMSAEPDRIRHIALGIGVNVNMPASALPPEVRATATSLSDEAGGPIDRTLFVRTLLEELDRWYRVFLTAPGDVLREWEALNMTTGRRISVSGPDGVRQGRARGIDAEGRLLLELDGGGIETVSAGDVTILKTPEPAA